MAVGMYTSDLDYGHNGGWDIYVPVKKFWIIALLASFSIVKPLTSGVPLFSNIVKSVVERKVC